MATFHADVHILASVAGDPVGGSGNMSGGVLLFNPGAAAATIRRVTISTDTAMRIVVGTSDQDNERIRAGTFAANGGAAPDCCVELNPGQKVYVFHSAAGVIDVSIDGETYD